MSLRKAELEHRHGSNKEAKKLIERALRKTPNIFDAKRIYAEILLKDGDKDGAGEIVKWMKDKVNARDVGERRTNYRPYLETYAHYLTELGRYSEAKEIFSDRAVFSSDEATKEIKAIEVAQAYRQRRS